ncbi:FMN-binding protein [Micromonospora sp. WMMA1923]|uniref:FMN-binding protein n=1 Tax=Micromonospora sp. WMMA1923 TaxID=3404125 RepID=UPI003B93BFF3
MRRALLAITGLAAGTTALVVLKGAPDTTVAARDLPVDRPPVVPSGTGPTATPPVTPTPSRTRKSPNPSRTTAEDSAAPRTTTRPPTTRAAPRTPDAPRTTSAAPKPTRRTVTGPVVENEYGNVQVRITLDGRRIVDATALELPRETAQSDRRSSEVDGRYSGTSGQVVQRQSAEVDTVSGATATSGSYRQSLQAALDRAR